MGNCTILILLLFRHFCLYIQLLQYHYPGHFLPSRSSSKLVHKKGAPGHLFTTRFYLLNSCFYLNVIGLPFVSVRFIFFSCDMNQTWCEYKHRVESNARQYFLKLHENMLSVTFSRFSKGLQTETNLKVLWNFEYILPGLFDTLSGLFELSAIFTEMELLHKNLQSRTKCLEQNKEI